MYYLFGDHKVLRNKSVSMTALPYRLCLFMYLVIIWAGVFPPVSNAVAESTDTADYGYLKTIVCIVPMTGEHSLLGDRTIKGVVAAREAFEKGYEYDIVVIDSGTTDINTAYKRALSEYNAAFIIGPLPGSGIDSTLFHRSDSDVPSVLFPLGSDAMSGPSVIRFYYPMEIQVRNLIEFIIRDRNIESFAVLYPNTRLGKTFSNIYERELRKRGRILAYRGSYEPDDLDISGELKWIESIRPDVIFIPDTASRSTVIIKQLVRDRNLFNTFFIGPNTWNSKAFLTYSDERIDGIIYKTLFTDFVDMSGKSWSDFESGFRGLYSDDPGAFEYGVFEITGLLMRLQREADQKKRGLMDLLSSKSGNYSGFKIMYSKNGTDIYLQPKLFTMENGKIKKLQNIR